MIQVPPNAVICINRKVFEALPKTASKQFAMTRVARPSVRRKQTVQLREKITPEMEEKLQQVKAAYLQGELEWPRSGSVQVRALFGRTRT
jgi:hypothetical protein